MFELIFERNSEKIRKKCSSIFFKTEKSNMKRWRKKGRSNKRALAVATIRSNKQRKNTSLTHSHRIYYIGEVFKIEIYARNSNVNLERLFFFSWFVVFFIWMTGIHLKMHEAKKKWIKLKMYVEWKKKHFLSYSGCSKTNFCFLFSIFYVFLSFVSSFCVCQIWYNSWTEIIEIAYKLSYSHSKNREKKKNKGKNNKRREIIKTKRIKTQPTQQYDFTNIEKMF